MKEEPSTMTSPLPFCPVCEGWGAYCDDHRPKKSGEAVVLPQASATSPAAGTSPDTAVTPSKTDRFDELEELLRAATPLPWTEEDIPQAVWPDDARFIVAAVNALPALLAERKRLRAALGKLLAEVEWREGEDTPYMVYAEMNVEAWREARSLLQEGSATPEEEQERG